MKASDYDQFMGNGTVEREVNRKKNLYEMNMRSVQVPFRNKLSERQKYKNSHFEKPLYFPKTVARSSVDS